MTFLNNLKDFLFKGERIWFVASKGIYMGSSHALRQGYLKFDQIIRPFGFVFDWFPLLVFNPLDFLRDLMAWGLQLYRDGRRCDSFSPVDAELVFLVASLSSWICVAALSPAVMFQAPVLPRKGWILCDYIGFLSPVPRITHRLLWSLPCWYALIARPTRTSTC